MNDIARVRSGVAIPVAIAAGSMLLGACATTRKADDYGPYEGVVSERVVVDPSGHAPLTAVIDIETDGEVTVESRVVGRHGPLSDVRHVWSRPARRHRIAVLGLYPAQANDVELTFFGGAGNAVGTRSYTVQTAPLSERLPEIVIEHADHERMAPGMTLLSYFPGAGGSDTPQLPLIFDAFGDIRWYLDYAGHPRLGALTYDDGVERLRNGDLYFGDKFTDRIFEVTMLGEIVDSWTMPGYAFHHNVQEKPDGNLLVTVSKEGASTEMDHVIEIDRQTKEIVTVWDLRRSLEVGRTVLGDDESDWAHVNAVIYDARDDSIIVAARVQGVVKLTRSNDPVWILAPHDGWGTSGDGKDLTRFLLTPLHADGEPIEEAEVVRGHAAAADFDWPWMAHAPQLMPGGDLLLFDNGARRHFAPEDRYSRAVEYAIDEKARTVRQVWAYGQERGEQTYAVSVSDVDFLPDSDHVIFAPGNSSDGDRRYGTVIELDYDTREVLFEATVTMPGEPHGITFHRAERLSLYPDSGG